MTDKCDRERGRDVVHFENVEEKLEREFHQARRRGDLRKLPCGEFIYVAQYEALEALAKCSSRTIGSFDDFDNLYEQGIKFGNIKIIDLSHNSLTDTDLEPLQDLPELELIYLYSNTFGDNGLSYLQGLSKIQKLIIADTNVGNEGLQYLSGLSNLQRLDIGETLVTDEGLHHLYPLSKLNYLATYGTEVTDQGLQQIKERFPEIEFYRDLEN